MFQSPTIFITTPTRNAGTTFQIGLDVPISLADHFTIKPFAALSVPLSAIDEFAKKEGWGGRQYRD
jgi:hypothetical protein